MPFYQKPRNFTPLHKAAEKKSIKNGLHHAIFTSKFDRYVGDWHKDLKEGKGKFLTINGKKYEGDWYKGFRHGYGILSRSLPNGTYTLEYRGDWVRGKPEGIGWMFYKNGGIYLGFWKAGQMQGFGNMWYANKTFYVGYWNKGQREGLGMYVLGGPSTLSELRATGGSKWQVPVQCGVLKGMPLSNSGRLSVNCWLNYQECVYLANGNRYEGHWEKDLKNGFGRFYHIHTGQLQEGCWEEGVCVKSKISDIIIRQFCDQPTQYPIPAHKLKFARSILEYNDYWLKQKIGELDKNIKICIDQM